MDSASRSTTTGRVVFGENITDFTLQEYRRHYDDEKITKLDIFWYVYGLLHHNGYRKKYANNLSRELPRIPMAPDFEAFCSTGKQLADLHLNFETCKRYRLKKKAAFGSLKKMAFAKKREDGKQKTDKTILRINGVIVFENIPHVEYQVNGRTPLEWIVDRYHLTTDKDSGITNNPCEDMTEQKTVELVERMVHIGVESDRMISQLPEEFEPREPKGIKKGIERFTG